MENKKSTTVMKVNINGEPLYVQCEWKCTANDLFHIKIFNETGVWKGRYSYDFAREFKKNIDGTEEQYLQAVKDALKGKDNSFKFEFTSQIPQGTTSPTGGDGRKFVWIKTFPDEAEFVYGAVPVHLAEDLSTFSLVDLLLQENKILRGAITEFEHKHKQLSDDLEKCNKCLEKFVATKENLESHLYGRFLQLINAKKRRINILENCIQTDTQHNDGSNEVD